MATADQESECVECSVCQDYFVEPKILPCAHLLCRNCLVTLMKSSKEKRCPLCRSAIVTTKDHVAKRCEDIADSLPTDLSMAAIVESTKTLRQDHFCCECDNAAAESMCLTCEATMCPACVRVHDKLPALHSHRVVNMANLSPGLLASIHKTSCASHTGEPSRHFCSDHNVPICHLCATSKHRTCSEVADMEDVLKWSQQLLCEMKVLLKEKDAAFSKIMKRIDDILHEIDNNKSLALASVDKVCDYLQHNIEACRQRLRHIVEDSNVKTKIVAQGTLSALGRKRGRVKSHMQIVERVVKTLPSASIRGMTALLSSRIKELDLDTSLATFDLNAFVGTLSMNMDEVQIIKEELMKLKVKKIIWRFHSHHGKNIHLTNNRLTSECTDYNDGIVTSSHSMKTNHLYEVHVDSTDRDCTGDFIVTGVLLADPSTLELPTFVSCLETAVGIRCYDVCVKSQWIKTNCGRGLKNISKGCRVGVLIDTAGNLHLYVDGKDQGVVVRGVKQPCYAMFNPCLYVTKITALPVTVVQCV